MSVSVVEGKGTGTKISTIEGNSYFYNNRVNSIVLKKNRFLWVVFFHLVIGTDVPGRKVEISIVFGRVLIGVPIEV